MAKARTVPKTTDQKSAGGVQSLHRAMSILQAVAVSRDGITLSELCKQVGLHSSTTFHLSKTMVTLGLLRQEPDSKRYRIGPQLFGLASGALDEMEILRTSSPRLASLAESTGENSHIGVWAGREVVIVAKCDGTASVRLAERIGVSRPAYATAIGKVLLADLSEEDLDNYLQNCEFRQITPKTIVEPNLLREVIEDVRAKQIAFDDAEFDGEVRCIAAPVRDFSGRVIASVGISAPVWRLNLTKLNSATEQVKAAAADLSEAFGGQGVPGRASA